jgi:hypothetical protein
MPGRHQALSSRRARLRWLAALAGGAVVGAILLAFSSATASATSDPVKATFGVTGVATDGCAVSAGGTDVYVKPGQDLDVHSSLAGITLLGIPLDFSKIVSLDGNLTIGKKSFPITGDWKTLSWGKSGSHKWSWEVDQITLLNALHLPVTFNQGDLIALGIQPSWSGTVHVTSDRTKCGIAIQLPSVSASVSVTGLPPIAIGVPGVKVTVSVDIPTALPTNLPGVGGTKTSNPGGGASTPAPEQSSNPLPVPAQVVPGIDGSGLLGSGDYTGGLLPGSGSSQDGAGVVLQGASSTTPAAENLPDQDSTGKDKTIDLAASPTSSTGEVWVVLAIVAVIALAFVAATYARLYLMKHEV